MRPRKSEVDSRVSYHCQGRCSSCCSYARDRRIGRKQHSLRYSDDNGQICSRCNVYKSWDNYARTKSGRDRVHTNCKLCHKLSYYGELTPDEYQFMLEHSNDTCYVCGREPDPVKALAIDHDHNSGEIRGLLCDRCNLCLGLMKDSLSSLDQAVLYLSQAKPIIPERLEFPYSIDEEGIVCRYCGIHQLPTSFQLNNKGTGRGRICNRCRSYSSKYKITVHQYNQLVERQSSSCAVCRTVTGKLQVDHDHECCPGKNTTCGKCIRGLLCGPCNQSLGLVADNKVILTSMIQYLRKT